VVARCYGRIEGSVGGYQLEFKVFDREVFDVHDLIGRTSEMSSRNISPHAAADI
jgi:hypothetical protein